MKKIVLLIIAISICLTSCNKDDEGGSSDGNIIGKWGLYKDVNVTDNIITEEYDINDPENQMTFKSNGVLEVYFSDENYNIIDTWTGSWKHIGGTKYELNLLFTIVSDIEFINNNEFRIKYVDLFDESDYEEWGYYKRI
jgi:hypothetical protein